MPGPQPSPTPGSSPRSPQPSAPSVPDYSGAAGAAVATSSTKNPNDIWGLGDVYGMPVYLGVTQVPEEDRGGLNLNGPKHSNDRFGTTQDIMQQAIDMWSAQQTERKSNPHALTGYEQLQQALYAGGFYGQTSYSKIHAGQWTSQTQGALNEALKQYEQVRQSGVPMTWTDFIQGNAGQNSDGGFFGGSGTAAQAPVISTTDPESIRQAAQAAAQGALGQGLSDDQLSKFVAQFQAAQVGAQTATTGTVNSPDLGSDAMAFVQQSNPDAYKQNQRTAYLDQLVNLLGGSRPNQQPVASAGAP